jgi:predicted lysophospholipase L1 biosynthesis ABC-type transport system permease subunit
MPITAIAAIKIIAAITITTAMPRSVSRQSATVALFELLGSAEAGTVLITVRDCALVGRARGSSIELTFDRTYV